MNARLSQTPMNYAHYSDDDLVRAFNQEVERPISNQIQEGSPVLEVLFRAYVESNSYIYSVMDARYKGMYMSWLLQTPGLSSVMESHDVGPEDVFYEVYMRMRHRLQDVTREQFFHLFHNRPNMFFGYVRTVIRTTVIDMRRRRTAPLLVDLPEDISAAEATDPLTLQQLLNCTEQVRGLLSEDEWRLIELRAIMGYAPRQIAEHYPEFGRTGQEISRRINQIYMRLRRNPSLRNNCLDLF